MIGVEQFGYCIIWNWNQFSVLSSLNLIDVLPIHLMNAISALHIVNCECIFNCAMCQNKPQHKKRHKCFWKTVFHTIAKYFFFVLWNIRYCCVDKWTKCKTILLLQLHHFHITLMLFFFSYDENINNHMNVNDFVNIRMYLISPSLFCLRKLFEYHIQHCCFADSFSWLLFFNILQCVVHRRCSHKMHFLMPDKDRHGKKFGLNGVEIDII